MSTLASNFIGAATSSVRTSTFYRKLELIRHVVEWDLRFNDNSTPGDRGHIFDHDSLL